MKTDPLSLFKSFYSVLALIFSTVLIMGLIFTRQTKLSNDLHPAVAFCVIWLGVIWLSMIEGGQASLVGLAPVNRELYKDSHPTSYKCTSLCHKGGNLDRYLLGRQFMVVLVVFSVNQSGNPLEGASLWGLPKMLEKILFGSGLAMILFTCMIGQLNSQVNASHCMLDYINNHFALFTLWVAMAIEFSGLLHASYLLAYIVFGIAGKKVESLEEPRNIFENIFFWGRVLLSVTVLGLCFTVTITALFDGKTTMWPGVPSGLAIVIFFLLMCVVGQLEAMQIAFFAVSKIPVAERGTSRFAKMTCECLFRGEKQQNLSGFMIGRQLCVVSCMFFIARVTSVKIEEGETNVFDVSDGLQALFNTGLLGAIITTIVGSIAWQLVASVFPIAVLTVPSTYIFLRWCLFLEGTGICHGAWVLAWIHAKIANFQYDEVYIGTAEERAAKNVADDETQLPVGPGHLIKLPGFVENAPESLKKLMHEDPAVQKYIVSLHDVPEQVEK